MKFVCLKDLKGPFPSRSGMISCYGDSAEKLEARKAPRGPICFTMD